SRPPNVSVLMFGSPFRLKISELPAPVPTNAAGGVSTLFTVTTPVAVWVIVTVPNTVDPVPHPPVQPSTVKWNVSCVPTASAYATALDPRPHTTSAKRNFLSINTPAIFSTDTLGP